MSPEHSDANPHEPQSPNSGKRIAFLTYLSFLPVVPSPARRVIRSPIMSVVFVRIRAAALTTVLTVFVCSCGNPPEEVAPNAAPRNVLIVLMDATVATHMYPWGYARDPAPNFRKIARGGMLFTNAHSQAANTTPSVWSFSTGRYPYVPEPLGTYTTHRPYDSDYMMPEAFRDAGFRTAAFSESPWIRDKFGWGKGFDTFEYVPGLYDHQGLRWTRDPGATAQTLDRAREWIGAQGKNRWFAYVHLLRPHDPYDAPAAFTARYTREPHRSHDHPRAEHVIREVALADRAAVTADDIAYLVDMYDANIRYVDDLVGQFYEQLERAGVTDDTLVVLMSDHGEAFMEHGDLGHNTTVYEEMTHVPLAMIAPAGHGFARGVHGGLVDLVDLMPTFADLFQLSPPAPYPGRSLAPVLRGEPSDARATSIAHSAMDHFQFSLREGDLKLIAHVDGEYRKIVKHELYDLAHDPGEHSDLASDTSLAAPLLEKAAAYLAGIERKDSSDDPELEPEDVDALNALGYLPSKK